MKIRLFILLMLLCPDLKAQATYPLQVGNRWAYNTVLTSVYSGAEKVIGDTLISSSQYAVIQSVENPSLVEYWRQEGSQIFQYLPGGGERLEYDFGRNTGDTVSTYRVGRGNAYVILNNVVAETVFGSVVNVYYFVINVVPSGPSSEVHIADGFGVNYKVAGDPGKQLAGAVINGVTYGEIARIGPSAGNMRGGFALYQNYPNPFNPSTLIRYDLRVRSAVKLEVFDLLGNRLSEPPINGIQESGEHQFLLDASSYPSGVYYYRLTVSGGDRPLFMVRRMTVLK